jgi:hypothetical protein
MKLFDYLFYKWYVGFKDFTKLYKRSKGIEGFSALTCMALFFFFNLVSIVSILKSLEIGTDFFQTFHIGPLYYIALCLLLFLRYYKKSNYRRIILKYEVIDEKQSSRTSAFFLSYITLSFLLFFFSIYLRMFHTGV